MYYLFFSILAPLLSFIATMVLACCWCIFVILTLLIFRFYLPVYVLSWLVVRLLSVSYDGVSSLLLSILLLGDARIMINYSFYNFPVFYNFDLLFISPLMYFCIGVKSVCMEVSLSYYNSPFITKAWPVVKAPECCLLPVGDLFLSSLLISWNPLNAFRTSWYCWWFFGLSVSILTSSKLILMRCPASFSD